MMDDMHMWYSTTCASRAVPHVHLVHCSLLGKELLAVYKNCVHPGCTQFYVLCFIQFQHFFYIFPRIA